jgi:hypothetical protein
VEVLNGISLPGGLVASRPEGPITAQRAAEALLEHGRFGLPPTLSSITTRAFKGHPLHRSGPSSVPEPDRSLRFLLRRARPGFKRPWRISTAAGSPRSGRPSLHDSLAALQLQSARYVAAYRQRATPRMEGSPARRPFPSSWQADLQLRGKGA